VLIRCSAFEKARTARGGDGKVEVTETEEKILVDTEQMSAMPPVIFKLAPP
jgi:hypothetical protein